MFLFNLFKPIEEIDSKYNGKIKVIRDLEGTRIVAGGISQSGWLMKKVWLRAISRISREISVPKKVLILGLGGGSVAEVVSRAYPQSNILGVDIDEEIVKLGKKYLSLSKVSNLDIKITDARIWVKGYKGPKFDMILVDLFLGENIPEFFTSEAFCQKLKGITSTNGVVLFNHLFSKNDKQNAFNFQKTLRKTFSRMITIYPEVNVIFVCFPKSIS